ncbi:MAG: hypothetical protein ACW98X_25505 [Promethearchaeota archaeon]|jgi:hypothetical protein
MATQIKNAVDATIKEFLNDLKSGMKIPDIQNKWEKKLNIN